jgi:hypothetical protein
MASPILALAPVMWKAIFRHHHYLQFHDQRPEHNLFLETSSSFRIITC